MLEIAIPGGRLFTLEYLVLDYNGTMACDGQLLSGVGPRLVALSSLLRIHVLTADTFGNARRQLGALPCEVTVLPPQAQVEAKRAFVRHLGGERVVCIGNGRNDQLMLEEAALGIAVIQAEGAAPAILQAADVLCNDIRDALDLLRQPRRLQATLRR